MSFAMVFVAVGIRDILDNYDADAHQVFSAVWRTTPASIVATIFFPHLWLGSRGLRASNDARVPHD